jgi:Phage integrase family
MRIHVLRHTYATLLLQANAPITDVSAQLGHRDASITLRVYAHYLPSASQREADRLDTVQPSATPAQPEAVGTSGSVDESSDLFRKSGEPNVRELEPDCCLAEECGRTQTCCLSA